MSTDDPVETPTEATGDDTRDDTTSVDLAAEIDRLTAENRRLREEYAHTRHAQHRRAAIALTAVGLIAGLAGLVFTDARRVLFVLCGIGVFAGVLTYYLTPERFIPARIGEMVYETTATNLAAAVTELGLHDDRIYVPVPDYPASRDTGVRLFIPVHAEYDLPTDAEAASLFVTPETDARRGIALAPIGSRLFEAFEDARSDPLSSDPGTLADQLTDGLIEQFELAASATPDADPEAGRVTIGITDPVFGAVDQVDHPITSFLAVGLATGLGVPIHADTTGAADDRYEYLITLTWSTGTLGDATPADTRP